MLTLDTVVKKENNNFDLVRLFAALMVVFGHSFELFNSNGYPEPIRYLLKNDYSGSLAVYIFFFLSGLFITASFVNAKNYPGFILMRLFRIWPALIVCCFITAFIAGPLLTAYPLKQYFAYHATWSYGVRNTLLYSIQFYLPGVFQSNYYPIAVNGSLWTLPIEVCCYLFVFVAGIIGVFKNKFIVLIIFCLIAVAYCYQHKFLLTYANKPFLFFLAGSVIYNFKKYILIDFKLLLVLLAAWLLFHYDFLFYITLMYAILVLASPLVLKRVILPGDYSYGIYIYGYLTQQITSFYAHDMKTYQSLLIVVPSVIIIAACSWHFIEYPAIKLGRKLVLLTQKKQLRYE